MKYSLNTHHNIGVVSKDEYFTQLVTFLLDKNYYPSCYAVTSSSFTNDDWKVLKSQDRDSVLIRDKNRKVRLQNVPFTP